MGYSMDYSGAITIPAATNDTIINTHEFPAWVNGTGARRIAEFVAEEFGAENPTYTVTETGDVIADMSGHCNLRDQDELLALLAEHDATGEIECVGEDNSLWKWELTDGEFREYLGRIVYDDTPKVIVPRTSRYAAVA
jgi:hypothetical protein